MNIGIPKETFHAENRLALSPLAAKTLVLAGHEVYLQAGAGEVSFYDDSSYIDAGAQIVYSPEEVFGRAHLVAKVERPSADELQLLQKDQILMSFLQPVGAAPSSFQYLLDKNICAVGLEIIKLDDGTLPIVRSLSEICGHMSVTTAARLLESQSGGRGIILNGAPGVPPAEVVIIGAGTLGRTAAETAIKLGASVTVLDNDVEKLRQVRDSVASPIVTAMATAEHIDKALSYADVLITAIRIPRGGKVRAIVSREAVRKMKNGAVIVDTAIDQGGAVETSRPTTLDNPTFIKEGVVHYCVPNMSSAVPRTASRVLTDSVLPLIMTIANKGLMGALRNNTSLARGVFTLEGKCCNEKIAALFDLPYTPIDSILNEARK